jgi:high affinity sulfate transporter 1
MTANAGRELRGASALVPSITWLRAYQKSWLRPDLIAGVTAAAVVIPKAMAYATIAGLPVQVGLYTVFVPMVVYALLGTSRPLSVSTTTTIAILAASELGRLVPNGDSAELLVAAATLSVLCGRDADRRSVLRARLCRELQPEPVPARRFKSGIGLVIVVDQIPKLLGIHFDKGEFAHNVLGMLAHLAATNLAALALAIVVLGLIYGLHRFAPRAPAPLIAIAVGIAGSTLLGLPQSGVETIGTVARELPHFIWPRVELFVEMWPAAAGIALMGFTRPLRRPASRWAGEPRPAPNQELLAVGMANVAGGLLGAMPAGGGTSQTAVNRMAGARTQVAELVTAAVAVATLLVLAPLIALMPQAVLAAIVVAYSVGLISPAQFRDILRVRRSEFWWGVIALLGVVLLGTLQGILVAVVASLVALAYQAYNPPVYVLGRKPGTQVFRPKGEHADDETWPGLLLLRTEGRVFFANAPGIGEKMLALVDETGPSVVVLDCSPIPDIEYTALKMMMEADTKLRARGIELWVAALNPEVLTVFRKAGFADALGRERMLFNLQAAVDKFAARGANRTGDEDRRDR